MPAAEPYRGRESRDMTLRVSLITLLCLSISSRLFAQAADVDIRSLITSIEEEKQHIAELQLELERHNAVLTEISKRLEAITNATTPEAAAAPVAVPEKSVSPRFDVYGESVMRLDNLRQSYVDCPSCPMRTRGRFRVRLGAEGRLAPGLRAVAGISVGELNDPNTTYQTLGDNFSRKVATWDRAYIAYNPAPAKWMEVTAGKFPFTWLRSSMTFDVDLFPEGLSERFSFDLNKGTAVKNISLQGLQLVANEKAAGPDTLIIGGQASVRVSPARRLSTTAAFTELDFRRPEGLLRNQLTGANVGSRNTNEIILRGGEAFYASAFRYANAIVETTIQTGIESLPITTALEYQRNLRAASSYDSARSFRIDVGRHQQKGDWNFSWHVFRVEQDAIVSALGESDWHAPSNVIQHRYSISRMLHPNVIAVFTWYRGRTLDSRLPNAFLAPGLSPGRRDPWASRMYFDAIYRF